MKVYQIPSLGGMVNALGAAGFSREQICAAMPAYDAYLRTLTGGSEGYRPTDFQYYTRVATIDAATPEAAFRLMQSPFCEDPRVEIEVPCKSMSVGDILEVGGNGKPRRYFMVDGVGFSEVTV